MGHDLCVQLLHVPGNNRLIEKGRKVRQPFGAAGQDKGSFPDADIWIEKLWLPHDSVFGVPNLDQKISSLAVFVTVLALTVKRYPRAKGIRNVGVFEITAIRNAPVDMSAGRPRLEPVFETLRGQSRVEGIHVDGLRISDYLLSRVGELRD
jgi:hypothetical protein